MHNNIAQLVGKWVAKKLRKHSGFNPDWWQINDCRGMEGLAGFRRLKPPAFRINFKHLWVWLLRHNQILLLQKMIQLAECLNRLTNNLRMNFSGWKMQSWDFVQKNVSICKYEQNLNILFPLYVLASVSHIPSFNFSLIIQDFVWKLLVADYN